MKYIRVYGDAMTRPRQKGRSKRGWTEPGPKEIAAAELATQAKARAEAKAAKIEANRAKHEAWLKAHPQESSNG